MAAILLLFFHFTVTDPGVAPQPLASTAHLAVAHPGSVSPSSSYKLSVYSTVTDVDLKRGLIEMELLGLQASVERKLPGLQARLLAAAAGSGPDRDGGWGSSLAEQLGLGAAAASPQAEAVYGMRLTRCSWLRITHLTAALLQVVAVGWACLLLAGQCLSAFLLQRFLCSRLHGVWN
ncbi:hypothetical protein OEZ86_010099 [Tetradesmus obliquus]|uniref:Uncharacterized protein n=1 Tax=Tetradesmus obliquus TaxID=3088 RepID=A0ABY8US84_TETOB|nr:hypothetical protein OEZ85_001533 [Tetradesmus obliquus]WIA43661.1 hypothetical protein OEZ86_010099 [Tetradesmus obliquus]